MTSSTLSGGSIRILWDETDPAEVTITGGNASFTVDGASVSFPYTLTSSTTFTTTQPGAYTVSVQRYGNEIAGTPDGARPVSLRFGEEAVFAPTPDAGGTAALLPQVTDRVGIPAGVYATGANMTAANDAWFTRIRVTKRTPIYGIGIYVNASAGNVDAGLYDDDGPGGLPGTRLASSGSIVAPAAGTRKIEFTRPVVVNPGYYWTALASSASPVTGFAFLATATRGQTFDNFIVGDACQANTAMPLPTTIPQPIYQASSRQVGGMIPLVGFLGSAAMGGPGGLYPTRPGTPGSSYVGPYYEQASDSTYAISDKNWVQGTWVELDFSIVQSYSAADQLPTWTAAEVKHAGLVFAVTDNGSGGLNNNYVTMVSVEAQQFQLVKQVGGVETVLFKRNLTGSPLAYDTRYKLAAYCDGTNVTATLKNAAGVVIDTATVADSTYRGGFAGGHGYATKYRAYGLRSFEA